MVNKEKESKLTHEDLLRLLSYDLNTGIFTWIDNTSTRDLKNKIAGMVKPDYIYIGINNEEYLAHRLAWFYVTDTWPKYLIDHIDNNRYNNILSNLREATVAQNSYNSKKRTDNTSGFKGVSFDKSRSKFMAYINTNGKRKHLGRFKTAEEASEAYNAAAKELHGEFYKDTRE